MSLEESLHNRSSDLMWFERTSRLCCKVGLKMYNLLYTAILAAMTLILSEASDGLPKRGSLHDPYNVAALDPVGATNVMIKSASSEFSPGQESVRVCERSHLSSVWRAG